MPPSSSAVQTASVRLWLLRHAKSSWDDDDLADEDRPLAPRGERAADAMRAYLETNDIAPALVLCSSALRARQTLARVLPGLGRDLEVRIEPGLYTFDAGVLIERLRRVPTGVASVMVVGHNPALQDLAVRVTDRGDRLEDLVQKFPPGALAEIEVGPGSWETFAEPRRLLTRFVAPRELRVT